MNRLSLHESPARPSLSRRRLLAALFAALPGMGAVRLAGAHDGMHGDPPPPVTPATLPGESVYQIGVPLEDQRGRPFDLASLRGGPVLISMFYGSCQMVCPMIFETIQLTLGALPAVERDRVSVVMVSFDPERDDVPALARTAAAHGCDAHWTLARPDASGARKIAAVLGIQYRRLANGEFNHSSTIELLDPEGRIAARSGSIGAVDPKLFQVLRRMSGHG